MSVHQAAPSGCSRRVRFSPGVDEPDAPVHDLARCLGLEVEHGDAVGRGVHQALAVGRVAVLIEVQAGAVGLIGQSDDAMPGVGIDP